MLSHAPRTVSVTTKLPHANVHPPCELHVYPAGREAMEFRSLVRLGTRFPFSLPYAASTGLLSGPIRVRFQTRIFSLTRYSS